MSTDAPKDVITALRRDHRKVEKLLERLNAKNTGRWDDLFCELVQELVTHEVAEEEVVYPAIRRDVPRGDDIARVRVSEQSKVEELLARMEHMEAGSREFAIALDQLKKAILHHAQREEEQIFPLLKEHESASAREGLARRFVIAKDAAPTHPHPHAPDTPPGNMLVGSFTAVVDRVRDALATASD